MFFRYIDYSFEIFEKTEKYISEDVYLQEPLGTDHPLCKLQNVTLTPHIAGTSTGTFSFAVEEVCNGLEKLIMKTCFLI